MSDILVAINAVHTFPVTPVQQGFPSVGAEGARGQESEAFPNRGNVAAKANRSSGHKGSSTIEAPGNFAPVSASESAPSIQGSAQSNPESDQPEKTNKSRSQQAENKDETRKDFASSTGIDGEPLTASDKLLLQKLRQIDISVRAHERAHLAAAGGIAVSGASFTTKRGPDGRTYAVGGEVRIDTSPESTPEATAAKMQRIRAAALAPADPSPQDRSVASQASKVMVQAQMEIRETRTDEAREDVEESRELNRVEGEQEQKPVGEISNENRQETTSEQPVQQAVVGYGTFLPPTGSTSNANGGIDITV